MSGFICLVCHDLMAMANGPTSVRNVKNHGRGNEGCTSHISTKKKIMQRPAGGGEFQVVFNSIFCNSNLCKVESAEITLAEDKIRRASPWPLKKKTNITNQCTTRMRVGVSLPRIVLIY